MKYTVSSLGEKRSMFGLKNKIPRKDGCLFTWAVPVRPSIQALFNLNVLLLQYHQPSTLISGLQLASTGPAHFSLQDMDLWYQVCVI